MVHRTSFRLGPLRIHLFANHIRINITNYFQKKSTAAKGLIKLNQRTECAETVALLVGNQPQTKEYINSKIQPATKKWKREHSIAKGVLESLLVCICSQVIDLDFAQHQYLLTIQKGKG